MERDLENMAQWYSLGKTKWIYTRKHVFNTFVKQKEDINLGKIYKFVRRFFTLDFCATKCYANYCYRR